MLLEPKESDRTSLTATTLDVKVTGETCTTTKCHSNIGMEKNLTTGDETKTVSKLANMAELNGTTSTVLHDSM